MSGIDRLDRLHNKPTQSAAQREKEDQHGYHAPRESDAGHYRGRFDVFAGFTATGTSPSGGAEQEGREKDGWRFHQIKIPSIAIQSKSRVVSARS